MKYIIALLVSSVFLYGSYNKVYGYDPFIKLLPIEKVAKKARAKKRVVIVSAILTNRAFINGRWFERGDKIGSYKVAYVKPKKVKLVSKHKNMILYVGKRYRKVLNIKDEN